MRAWLKTLNMAAAAKVASTSTSLSDLKSPRKTEPKSASSLIFHLRQKLSMTSSGISRGVLLVIIGYVSNGCFGPFQRLRFSILIVGHCLVVIFQRRIRFES